ncbi:hypothetical protein BDR04DRAFT_997215, partial [Suillus decipiens]
RLADAHARHAMNVSVNEPTPPYIMSIHIQHGDFYEQCEVPVDQFFASFFIIAQWELRIQKGIEVTHVIMTSDESDPGWWSEVRALGWM